MAAIKAFVDTIVFRLRTKQFPGVLESVQNLRNGPANVRTYTPRSLLYRHVRGNFRSDRGDQDLRPGFWFLGRRNLRLNLGRIF